MSFFVYELNSFVLSVSPFVQGVGDDEQAEEEHEDLLPPGQHRPPHHLCRLCHYLLCYGAHKCKLVKLNYIDLANIVVFVLLFFATGFISSSLSN